MNDTNQPTVLITDIAWPDVSVERHILGTAGCKVLCAPIESQDAAGIETMMAEHQPDALLFCWAPVTAKAIAASPGLQIAARLGVGLDNLDVDACTQRGIWVTNVPDYCVEEVSDHALAMLLAWARGLLPFDRAVRQSVWDPASAQLRRIADLTVGIIGYGNIGRRTVEKLSTFNVDILVNTRSPVSDARIKCCDLSTLAVNSDVIILHLPLTADTYHLVDTDFLEQCKPGGLLINVSRGGIVDTEAVIAALKSGQLSAAAFDVLENEPDVPEALSKHPNCIITPHVAFASDASIVELRRRASEDVVRVLQGKEPLQARNSPVHKTKGTT